MASEVQQQQQQPVLFSRDIQVQRLDTHSYSAHISDAFSVGNVPNGGYTASIFLEVVRAHMSARNQSDAIATHFEFVARTEPGPAVFVVEDVKLGRRLSTLHITLHQHALPPQAPWVTPGTSRKAMAAYITCADLQAESGITPPTGFRIQPSPPPVDLAQLAATGEDRHWSNLPQNDIFRRLGMQVRLDYFVPQRGQPSKSVVDVWLRLSSGERFTNTSLPFAADAWPHVVEQYRAPRGQQPGPDAVSATELFWYPTVVLNMDLKKGIGADGAAWLPIRVVTKEIKHGRLDLEVLIFDHVGDLVAIANHVNLILGVERNLAKRDPPSRM